MFGFLRFHPKLASLNAVIILCVTLFALALPIMFRLLIEGILPDGNQCAFLLAALLLLLVTFGRTVCGVLQDYLFLLHRQKIERSALQRAVQVTPAGQQRRNLAQTWGTVQHFMANFQFFWIEFAFYVAYAVFIASLVLIGFYWIEPWYFWLALGFMALHALNFALLRPRVDRAAQQFGQHKARLNAEVESQLAALPEMQSMQAEAFLRERLDAHAAAYGRAFRQRELAALWQQLGQDSLIHGFHLLFFLCALYLSVAREVSLGSAALALFLAGFLFEPIYRLNSIVKSLFEARAYTAWIPAAADAVSPVSGGESTHPAQPLRPRPALRLSQLQTGIMAARHQTPLDCHLQAGSMVLIRGSSGCGKSTLLDCLAGLEPPASGQINASGPIYYCEQESAIFPGSIADNLSFYARAPNRQWIEHLLHALHLQRLGANQSPANCSGGQKQRLALARSLYCGQDILLYDEPTAALDGANEQAVWAYLAELAKEKLVIVVSHSALASEYCRQVIDLG